MRALRAREKSANFNEWRKSFIETIEKLHNNNKVEWS